MTTRIPMKMTPKQMAGIKAKQKHTEPINNYANGEAKTGADDALDEEFGTEGGREFGANPPRPPLGNDMVTGKAMNSMPANGPIPQTTGHLHADPMQDEIDKGGRDFMRSIKARNRHIKGKGR